MNPLRPLTSSGRPGTALNRPTTSGRRNVMDLPPSSGLETPAPFGGSGGGGMWPTATPGRTAAAATMSSRRGTSMVGGPLQGLPMTSPISVVDRPMTQQGLGGLRTSAGLKTESQRTVQDKSYFLGVLRAKMGEVQREIKCLNRESDRLGVEQQNGRALDEQAADLALQLKRAQEELSDYNALVDKLSTSSDAATDVQEFRWELQELKQENERKAKQNEELFATKGLREAELAEVQKELDEEKKATERLLNDMPPDARHKYESLKVENAALERQIETMQQETDELDRRKAWLEEEVEASPAKREAYRLHEKIHDLEQQKTSLEEEDRLRRSPAEERETLLKQVKEDNQEISTMERHIGEIKERMTRLNEERWNVEKDLESAQSERSQQYLELKKREEMMDQFLGGFDASQEADRARIASLEKQVVELLEKVSLNLSRSKHLPTTVDLRNLQDDLAFKESELEKSKSTVQGLSLEQQRLQVGLMKMEELERKMRSELTSLSERLEQMRRDEETFSDVEGLRRTSQEKEKELRKRREEGAAREKTSSEKLAILQAEHDALKKKLNENEAHVQLGNLERKWQHVEQNNFLMKEYINGKRAESDYSVIVKNINAHLAEHNAMLQANLLKR